MNIGIDIDDTITNTHDVLFSYAQKYTFEELKRELRNPKEKIMAGNGYCQRFNEWNSIEARFFWDKYYEEILKKVTPREFAKDVIKKWREKGHKIYLITARFERPTFDVKKVTIDWLKDNEIEYDYIVFDAQDKQAAAKQNKIDILIDDAVPNCAKVAGAGIKTFIMDSMENQRYEVRGVLRLYSWIHADQEIGKIIN